MPDSGGRRGRAPEVRVGISGFSYRAWRGVFYPPRLPQHRELEFAGRRMNSVEINGTFYGLQRPASFQRWDRETPAGFRFAIKGSRYITHMKKLADIEVPLANFFASGPLALGEKLGPILWQFGPHWPFDARRFETFFDALPATTAAAARLARRHDQRLSGASWTRTDADRPIRYAFEVRHPSFFATEFVRLLRRRGAALVFADTAGVFPYAEDVTAPFVYLRLHGTGQLYVGGYDDAELDRWAERIRAWMRGGEPAGARRIMDRPAAERSRRDVYVYFDNDAKVHAPFDAMRLARRLGIATAESTAEGGGWPAGQPSFLSESEQAARREESGRRWRAS